MRAGDPLDQNCHLLISPVQPSLFPVFQRGQTHRAGIYSAYGFLKVLQTFLQMSAVCAENRLILAGKSISKAILQYTAGPDNNRIMPVVFQKIGKRLLQFSGKFPCQKLFRKGSCQRKIFLFCSLPYSEIPAAVFHNIGIIDIRPDVERIVGLQPGSKLLILVFHQSAGEQHPRRLSANHTGSDHVIPHAEIIFRTEMRLDHLPKPLISGHHNIAHTAALFRNIQTRGVFLLRAIKKPIPGIRILISSASLLPVHSLIKAAGLHTVQNRSKDPVFRIIVMRQQHGLCVTVPHLLRANIHTGAPTRFLRKRFSTFRSVRIYIQKYLRCITNPGNRLERVHSANQRKISHRIQAEQIRTGYTEKVAHHHICRPCRLQLRQAVKHIKSIVSFLFNQIVDLHRKIFKPVGQLNLRDFDSWPGLDQRRVAGKPHVNQIAVVRNRLIYKRVQKQMEFRQSGNPPDHIVAKTNMIQPAVHFGNTGFHSLKSRHISAPFLEACEAAVSTCKPNRSDKQ